jgi:hypothetical protein
MRYIRTSRVSLIKDTVLRLHTFSNYVLNLVFTLSIYRQSLAYETRDELDTQLLLS